MDTSEKALFFGTALFFLGELLMNIGDFSIGLIITMIGIIVLYYSFYLITRKTKPEQERNAMDKKGGRNDVQKTRREVL